MTDSASTDSPSEAGNVGGYQATDGLSFLTNETRLAILPTLLAAYELFSDDTWEPRGGNDFPYEALPDLGGMSDSSQFGNLLGELQCNFIEQTPDGCQLLPDVQQFVETAIGWADLEGPGLDQTKNARGCRNCNAPTTIPSQNQRLYWVCTACVAHIANDAVGLNALFDDLEVISLDWIGISGTGLGRAEVANG